MIHRYADYLKPAHVVYQDKRRGQCPGRSSLAPSRNRRTSENRDVTNSKQHLQLRNLILISRQTTRLLYQDQMHNLCSIGDKILQPVFTN